MLECSMSFKQLTAHHLEFLSLTGGCTGSSESTLVKIPHCRKSHTVKPVLNSHSQKDKKLVFKANYRLMQVKSIAECSKGSILQYFRPSLSYHLSLRSLFCIFLSGRLMLSSHQRRFDGALKRRAKRHQSVTKLD